MDLSKQNIMLFSRSTTFGGTEKVMLQIAEALSGEVNKIVICAGAGIRERLSTMSSNVVYYEIPDIEKKSLRVLLETLKIVSGVIVNERITVIHSHHRMAAFYAYLVSRRHKMCLIVTCHNVFHDKKLITRFIYQRANLISCGEMVKKNLVEQYGISESRIMVIYNCVDEMNNSIHEDAFLSRIRKTGNVLVGNIGRLSEQKGMKYFVDCAKTIHNSNPKVSFFIVGEGEERENLEKQVNKERLEGVVFFLGYRQDVQNLMAQLDIIVLSSLWEGFPLTPIEAFSVGKPVVATAVDGTREIVADGVNGFLVKPKSVEAMSEKIILLVDNPDLRKKMGLKAREQFEEHYSITTFKVAYIEYYKRILYE